MDDGHAATSAVAAADGDFDDGADGGDDDVVLLAARDPLKVPAILYLDSLLPVPKPLYQRLTQYLQEAWAARYPPPHPRSRMKWSKPPYIGGLVGPPPPRSLVNSAGFNLLGSSGSTRDSRAHHVDDDPLYEMKVPEQKNGCDCGLFLLEYTERFCHDGPALLRKWFQAQEAKRALAAASGLPVKATATRASAGANTRFEDILFKGWKITGMNQKRNQMLERIKSQGAHSKEQQHASDASRVRSCWIPMTHFLLCFFFLLLCCAQLKSALWRGSGMPNSSKSNISNRRIATPPSCAPCRTALLP
jgi:hypothetical protein